MRIGLFNGSTLYPLAGSAGESERAHSSAADFSLSPEAAKQIARFVRGAYAKPISRQNLLHTITFTTSRLFATPAEAQLWCLDYHTAFPSTGSLYFDAIAPDGTISRRTMANSVVDPPRRSVIGASVMLDYSVQGGIIATGSPPTQATGTITFSGQPTAAQTITIGVTVYSARAAASLPTEFQIGISPIDTAANLVDSINNSHPSVSAILNGTDVDITAITAGVAGNAIALSETATNVTVSGALLTGGTD